MPTKADFYVGRGPEAEWIGSLFWDVYPEGLPEAVVGATDEGTFRIEVRKILDSRPDGYLPENGWPWPWPNSITTPYTYAFDGKGVLGSYFGSSWWPASIPMPDPTTLQSKVARLPDMSMRPKIQPDPEQKLVYVK